MTTRRENIGVTEEAAKAAESVMSNKGTVAPTLTTAAPAPIVPSTTTGPITIYPPVTGETGAPYFVPFSSPLTGSQEASEINDIKHETGYDPQRTYDFSIETGDEVLDTVIESIDRPIPLPGSTTTLKAIFRDMADVDVLGKLIAWKVRGVRKFTVTLMKNDGTVVEELTSPRAEITSIKAWNRLDYDSNECVRYEVDIHGQFGRDRRT